MNKTGDLEEEDVWGFPRNKRNSSSKQRKDEYSVSESPYAGRFSTTTPKKIPKSNNETKMVQQSSAPMNIPDWSKIIGNVPKNGAYGETYDQITRNGDYDDDEDEMIPPHEWIARRLARSQISSFSVCEGVGRTLKGRDLSRVRNSILTKTGFLEN